MACAWHIGNEEFQLSVYTVCSVQFSPVCCCSSAAHAALPLAPGGSFHPCPIQLATDVSVCDQTLTLLTAFLLVCTAVPTPSSLQRRTRLWPAPHQQPAHLRTLPRQHRAPLLLIRPTCPLQHYRTRLAAEAGHCNVLQGHGLGRFQARVGARDCAAQRAQEHAGAECALWRVPVCELQRGRQCKEGWQPVW
jgi:hypothetical protein